MQNVKWEKRKSGRTGNEGCRCAAMQNAKCKTDNGQLKMKNEGRRIQNPEAKAQS
jgi:hypothetical protein